MENKINIAELLQDCPQGMELYSPIFGEVYLYTVRPHLAIVVTTDKEQGDFKEEFLYDGRYGMNGECMLFPSKGKNTWEGFQRPFKDGDIVALECDFDVQIFIFKEYIDAKHDYVRCYMMLDDDGTLDIEGGNYYALRLATEEEKQKLFKAIKDNGYKWNAETKTLEKLVKPQFKDGDILATDLGSVFYLNTRLNTDECYGCYVGISGDGSFHICEPFAYKECCGFATEEHKQKLFKAIKDRGYKWNAETNALVKVADMKYILEAKIKEYKRLEQEIGLMVISYYEEHIKTDDGFTLKNWQIDNADNIIIIYSYINDYGKTINQVRTISCNSLIE